MKNIRFKPLADSLRLFAGLASLGIILAGSAGISGNQLMAQGTNNLVINQAQRAIRDQIINQVGRRNQIVRFNNDAQTESRSNSETLVRGTGTVTDNNGRNNNSRNNQGRSRDFYYEATVNNRNNNRNRNNTVSGIKYEWREDWSGNGRNNDRGNGRNNDRGNGRNNDRGGYGDYNVQSIYCASDDGRRHNCPINNNGATVRLVNQRSGSNCVQGRTWGVDNSGIWVDRGCRADFEISSRGYGDNRSNNDRRDNNGYYSNPNRPEGRVSYSGPIMNRHSDKAMDVTEQGLQDGANIQQWSFADQANQNWDVIDIGNNEFAIISRHSGRALTVQGGRDNNGANIIQQGWNNSRQQRWRLEQTGGDYYRIVSVDNGKCLDVTERGKENGANIQLWNYANQANQQWRFKR